MASLILFKILEVFYISSADYKIQSANVMCTQDIYSNNETDNDY